MPGGSNRQDSAIQKAALGVQTLTNHHLLPAGVAGTVKLTHTLLADQCF